MFFEKHNGLFILIFLGSPKKTLRLRFLSPGLSFSREKVKISSIVGVLHLLQIVAKFSSIICK